MPINFDYSQMDVDLEELDELEEYVSDGDVDTDRVFEEEEGAEADMSRNFDKVVVVSNLPKIPLAKLEKLTGAMRKLLGRMGTIQEDGLVLPVNAEGSGTAGYAFVAFETSDVAATAVKSLNGFSFDKSHQLAVFPYGRLSELESWPAEYTEPSLPDFEAGPNLGSWLAHPALRDQYLLRHDTDTEIFWCEGAVLDAQPTLVYDGARERQDGKIWCEMYTAWSPQGSYLATYHAPGIALWGGDDFQKVCRFAHRNVQHILFSPNEEFLLTWNGSDNGRDARALIVWNIKTGREMRAFKVGRGANGDALEWPFMKFSADGQFVARLAPPTKDGEPGNGIAVYDTRTMGLLDKKSIVARGIQAFDWSPSDNLLAWWAPGVDNLPARVVLLDPAKREEVRSKNLFHVRDVKLHWQNAGDFLCAQVLRHSKTGKTTFTNFEIFRIRDANVPNEILEVKDMVEHFSWEPDSHRFGVIHGENQHRLSVTFYSAGAVRGGASVEKLYTVANKQVSVLHWSPAGNSVILAGTAISGELEWWDVDENVCTATEEHFMCNEVRWDPSGRMVATVVTQPMFAAESMKYKMESGYSLWSFQGSSVRKEKVEKFYQFQWRPRPRSTLSEEEKARVARGLKSYMTRYGKEDEVRRKRLDAAANKEKIEALTQYRALVVQREEEYVAVNAERVARGLLPAEDNDEYSFVEETEEVQLSEKVEPFF